MGDLDIRGIAVVGIVIVFLILLIRWGDFGSQQTLFLPVTMEADLSSGVDKTIVKVDPPTTAMQNSEHMGIGVTPRQYRFSGYEHLTDKDQFKLEEKQRKLADKQRNDRRYRNKEHLNGCRCDGGSCKVRKILEHLNDEQPKSFMQMTEGAKVQWIIDTFFKLYDDEEGGAIAAQTATENKFIDSLPADGTCPDLYDKCAQWAANDECTINPEWMLKNCPGSCQSCGLTPQQRAKLIRIYNSRPPVHCVYHGGAYPGEDSYMSKLLGYGLRSAY